MNFFGSCPICESPADAEIIKALGTVIQIHHKCTDESCTFCQVWQSQRFVGHKMAVGNLSASTLLSGC